ncbi:T9SS type A sorting domain-containing protein [Kordia sp.]|uniref:T9SS type A sorting domain-containing protein n=1 Tax=Kordia sp. TaxID=1965332 RepID=UPI003B5A9EFB
MKKILLGLLLFIGLHANAQYNFEELEINPNSNGNSSPHSFVEFNGEIYFNAFNDNSGRELWKTDGTQAGTVLVKDLYTGTSFFQQNSGDPRRLTVLNGELFFTAKTSAEGRELWKTDGTEAGTVLVKDILTGVGNGVVSGYQPFTIFNNKIVFIADEPGTSNTYLYESDGTNTGTKPISTLAQMWFSSQIESDICVYNGFLIFEGRNSNGANLGRELWKTDGTQAGTVLVKDINPGSSNSFPREMTVFNNIVYFHVEDNTHGDELWQTDGTLAGTLLVKDINPGVVGGIGSYAKFTEFNNKLYFLADDGIHGREIWFTDGTELGTEMLLDINSTGNQWSIPIGDGTQQTFYVFQNKLYFKATDSFNGGNIADNLEPWESDGTASGTNMISDLNTSGNSMNEYNYFIGYNDKLFFTTNDFSNATLGNLYVYDLTNTPIKISPPNTTATDVGTDFLRPIVFNESLYISASFEINNVDKGSELWKISDSTLSTDIIEEEKISIYPNPTSSILKINFSNNDIIKSVKLYNVIGQKMIFNIDRQNNIIDVSDLAKGVYILNIKTENKNFTKKIIKE